MSGTGFVVVWTCWCSDAAADVDTIPDHCPGHNVPRLHGPPVENTRFGPMRLGHACNAHPCPTTEETTR